MILDSFRRLAPWHDSASIDMQHAVRVEETLARVRFALILLSLLVAGLDFPASSNWLAVLLLGLLLVYSLVGLVTLRTRRVRTHRHVVVFHVVDTAGTLLVLVFTGGALSPFSTLFLYALLAAGYRWGQIETWTTAAVGVAVLAAHGAALHWAKGPSSVDLHVVALRIIYVAVGGTLVGYMAEPERIQRHSAWLVSRLLGRVRGEAGVVAAVRAVLEELLAQFRATHGVLVFDEEGGSRVTLWHASRSGESSRRLAIRLSQESKTPEAVYWFPVPTSVKAFGLSRARGEAADDVRVVAIDARGDRVEEPFAAARLLGTPFAWQSVFCASTMAGEGWTGRLYLFMPFDPPIAKAQLRYLRDVTRQVGPALFNLYLERRLQSRAGVTDRARISRELHDGVIQALIGIEMQLEVMRREASGPVPEPVMEQLGKIQRLLGQEILNVRDLMQLLKPEEVTATRLVEHLAEMVDRFRYRTGIQARLVCDADQIDLAPRVCRELAGIVREALANVRKHSGATSVVVRLARQNAGWSLIVDDNGCGLDFDGYLTPEEVEAGRKGPVVIKERARAIGGSVALRSARGSGTQLEITIPSKHHA